MNVSKIGGVAVSSTAGVQDVAIDGDVAVVNGATPFGANIDTIGGAALAATSNTGVLPVEINAGDITIASGQSVEVINGTSELDVNVQKLGTDPIAHTSGVQHVNSNVTEIAGAAVSATAGVQDVAISGDVAVINGSTEFDVDTVTTITNDVKVVNGATPFLLGAPFAMQVQAGLVPNHKVIRIRGHAAKAKKDEDRDVWSDQQGLEELEKFPWPTVAKALSVKSEEGDDNVGQIGARKVLLQGILADGSADTEEITLNGASWVTGTKLFTRLNRACVTEAGSAGGNVGGITITHDLAGTPQIIGHIVHYKDADTDVMGRSCSLDGKYTTANNETLYVFSAQCFCIDDPSKVATANFWVKTGTDTPWLPLIDFMSTSGGGSQTDVAYVKVPPSTDIRITCTGWPAGDDVNDVTAGIQAISVTT